MNQVCVWWFGALNSENLGKILDPKQFQFLGQTPKKKSRKVYGLLSVCNPVSWPRHAPNYKDFTQLAATCSSIWKRCLGNVPVFYLPKRSFGVLMSNSNSHALGWGGGQGLNSSSVAEAVAKLHERHEPHKLCETRINMASGYFSSHDYVSRTKEGRGLCNCCAVSPVRQDLVERSGLGLSIDYCAFVVCLHWIAVRLWEHG